MKTEIFCPYCKKKFEAEAIVRMNPYCKNPPLVSEIGIQKYIKLEDKNK